MNRIKSGCALLAMLFSIGASAASNALLTWKTDCVGRMQINLPGEVDQAAMLHKNYQREFRERWAQTPYHFTDEQPAGWNHFRFAGELLIAGPVSTEQTEALLQLAQQAQVRAKNGMKASAQEIGRPSPYRPLNVGPYRGYASRGAETFSARLSLGRAFVEWRLTFRPEHEDFALHSYETLITGLRERPLFEVPHEPGVCLPYAFIRDDGNTPRSIGMTYRLKDHPDITVWLEDSLASPNGPHVRSETLTPEYRANFFWTQDYQNAKRVSTEWRPTIRHTRIDGRTAVETFVRLVRYDDVEDYGYLTVVRGDPDAAVDTPDLMLYVIRDATNATKRGIEPTGKDEFIELARTIAASVKKRPVK